MLPVPWRTDRCLTPALAASLVGEQFAELSPARVEAFSEGWDSEAFLVNREYVFLFPKREEVALPFLRGVRLTRLVAGALPVSVPDFRFVGVPDSRFPYPFAGYPKIPGRPGSRVRPERRHWVDLAAVLGETLGALHSLDPAPFGDGETLGEVGPLSGSLADAVRGALGDALDARIEAYLHGEVEPPPPSGAAPVPTHADLLDYHILLEPEGRRITGVIDWMDSAVGDPAGDFVGPFLWLGEAFVEMILDRYPHPVDTGFLPRIRYRARRCALLEYGWSLHPASVFDPAIGRAWIDRAFFS